MTVIVVLASGHWSLAEVRYEQLTHDTVERDYILHVPSSYSGAEPVPLVLGIHGLGQDGATQMHASKMNDVSEREGFIVAYPSAIDRSWANSPDINLGFFDSLLDTIGQHYNIDGSRVYSTGLSQGAIRSYMLAVERPNVFAAIAGVAGVRPLFPDGEMFPRGLPALPERPFPLMHIHGLDDTVVPYEGGYGISVFPPVDEIIDDWANHNGCDATPSVSTLPDPRPTDSKTVSEHKFLECDRYTTSEGAQAAEVLLYQIDGGGHYWPSSSSELNASEKIWEFFSKHRLPLPSPLVGDFDADGSFTSSDIDMLSAALHTDDLSFDLTDDDRVDASDRDFWLKELAQTRFGDSNLDGSVAYDDFVQLSEGFGGTGGWADGDFDGDGTVAFDDFLLLANNFGYEAETALASVPEPSALGLALVSAAGSCLVLMRRQRSKQR